MNYRLFFLLLALAGVMSNAQFSRAAQEPNPPDDGEAPPPSAVQGQPGHFLSDGMVSALLKRSTYELARQLKMNDEQKQQLTRRLNEVWMPFFTKHRAEFGPVVDRMIQARWDPDLPSDEEAWPLRFRTPRRPHPEAIAVSNGGRHPQWHES